MRFDVYGRYELDVERHGGRWTVFRRGQGVRRDQPDIRIPQDLPEAAVAGFLEDLLHEEARPGSSIRRIE